MIFSFECDFTKVEREAPPVKTTRTEFHSQKCKVATFYVIWLAMHPREHGTALDTADAK